MLTATDPLARRQPVFEVPQPFASPRNVGISEAHLRNPFALRWPPKAKHHTRTCVRVDMRWTASVGKCDRVRIEDVGLGRPSPWQDAKHAAVGAAQVAWRNGKQIAQLPAGIDRDTRTLKAKRAQFGCSLREIRCRRWDAKPSLRHRTCASAP